MLTPYFPEPLTFFSVDENQHDFAVALKKVKNDLGHTYPLVIDNKKIAIKETFASVNPSRPEEVIGRFAMGDASHADAAIASATRAFDEWRRVPVEERARYLLRASAEMRRRKHEFSAMMVFEVGKSWAEADADTAEAIDFLEYYARQILRISDSTASIISYPSELLQLKYIPLGVGAVISPWNFPLYPHGTFHWQLPRAWSVHRWWRGIQWYLSPPNKARLSRIKCANCFGITASLRVC